MRPDRGVIEGAPYWSEAPFLTAGLGRADRLLRARRHTQLPYARGARRASRNISTASSPLRLFWRASLAEQSCDLTRPDSGRNLQRRANNDANPNVSLRAF